MKTYRALVNLPTVGQTPVTVEARSTLRGEGQVGGHVWRGQCDQSLLGLTAPYSVLRLPWLTLVSKRRLIRGLTTLSKPGPPLPIPPSAPLRYQR